MAWLVHKNRFCLEVLFCILPHCHHHSYGNELGKEVRPTVAQKRNGGTCYRQKTDIHPNVDEEVTHKIYSDTD